MKLKNTSGKVLALQTLRVIRGNILLRGIQLQPDEEFTAFDEMVSADVNTLQHIEAGRLTKIGAEEPLEDILGYNPAPNIGDHGALNGLNLDDHTQYLKADGTRALTGVISGVTPTADAHLATKGYVDGTGPDLTPFVRKDGSTPFTAA